MGIVGVGFVVADGLLGLEMCAQKGAASTWEVVQLYSRLEWGIVQALDTIQRDTLGASLALRQFQLESNG